MSSQVREQTKHLNEQELYDHSLELSRTSDSVIAYVEDEIGRFEEEVKAFRSGAVENAVFMPFRLHHGVYGQRQENRQMMRIKIPGGILTAEALEALGKLAENYAPLKKGHVTTRENMQFSHLLLEDCPEVMRLIGKAGLSTRDACANTVRNVVSSPLGGVCADELFDVTPYLAAYVRYAVRNPLTQNFPRKFKTGFTGCADHDAINAAVQDLSFIAQVRRDGGQEQRGFKVMVGGATSIMPRMGKVLYEFVAVEDYLRVSEAIWRVFDKADMLRKNRMMARIKVLIDRVGFDTFKEMVDTELTEVGPIDPRPLMNVDEINREEPPASVQDTNGVELPPEFLRWKESNAVAQKQAGYFALFVKLPHGDITSDQFPVLAKIVREYTGGRARTTQEQNLVLRWVPECYIYEVWKQLCDLGLAEADVNTITDVVSCPGTDSCKLGITSSMGLAAAIKEELSSWNGLLEDPLVKQLHIKISGCPNGCGLHHLANIGFHGAALRGPSGEQVPAYEVFFAGNYGGSSPEETRFGQRIPKLKIPAKKVPEAVRSFAHHYRENREDGEGFNDYVDRVGVGVFEPLILKMGVLGPLGPDTEDVYMDWSKSDLFKVERGEGECAV